MDLYRRELMILGVGAFAASATTGLPAFASRAEEEIMALTGGADIIDGGVSLIAPEIAENGNSVAIDVSAEGASSITLFGDGNPEPIMATMNCGSLSPTRGAVTRVRLHQTQNVIALAKMEDGTWHRASAKVKVTIGGCGG